VSDFEKRGHDRIVDTAVRFANRIAELEAQVRDLQAKLKAQSK